VGYLAAQSASVAAAAGSTSSRRRHSHTSDGDCPGVKERNITVVSSAVPRYRGTGMSGTERWRKERRVASVCSRSSLILTTTVGDTWRMVRPGVDKVKRS